MVRPDTVSGSRVYTMEMMGLSIYEDMLIAFKAASLHCQGELCPRSFEIALDSGD
jgi:hypothetical protein